MTPANAGVSVVLIAAVIGGVAGSLIMLAVVLLVALICKQKRHHISKAKCNDQQQSTHCRDSERVKTVRVQLEGEDNQSIKVNSNCAYNTFERLIPTENNVAYGQIQGNCQPNTVQYEYDYV